MTTGAAHAVHRRNGPLAFARFAYPPNELGYCGPDASGELLERVAAGLATGVTAADPGLRRLATEFEGAWPYLTLLAGAAGVDDPLDPAVVEAYWIGSPLLDQVLTADLGRDAEDRFRNRGPRAWAGVAATIAPGAVPHHSFHVCCISPWIGLLRGGIVAAPLHVVDRCRIRWATVDAVHGDTAVVTGPTLAWSAGRLDLGPPTSETVRLGRDGLCLVDAIRPGQHVAVHWDWICDRLTPARQHQLERWTRRSLAIANTTPTAARLA
jgi:Family of unknown function (DUF6390)